MTQLKRVQNEIGQANKNRHSIKDKRNLKIGTRFDLKNQNSTTENIVIQKA